MVAEDESERNDLFYALMNLRWVYLGLSLFCGEAHDVADVVCSLRQASKLCGKAKGP